METESYSKGLAGVIADESSICLVDGEKPEAIAAYSPQPGGFLVNLERAQMLGLREQIAGAPEVDELIVSALALSPKH